MSGRGKKPAGRTPPARGAAASVGRDSWRLELARGLWVEHQASERETCAACGVARATLRAWRKERGWDAERMQWARGWSLAAAALRRRVFALSEALERAGTGDLERVIELNAALRPCLDNARLALALDGDVDMKRLALRWLRGLASYLKARDVEALRALLPHLKAYGREIALG